MRAWACGERRMRPTSMPGAVASAPNFARPVTLSIPSGRSGRVPTTLKSRLSCSVLSNGISSPPHFLGGVHDGPNDLVIARAAAEIARQPKAHFGLARLWIFLQQRLGSDQDARRADS